MHNSSVFRIKFVQISPNPRRCATFRATIIGTARTGRNEDETMKSTFTPNQMRLIGKAWEVRHLLRVLVSQAKDRHAPLTELLERRQLVKAKAEMHAQQQHTRRENTTDRRVIPFPLS